MKWIITTILTAAGNVVIMMLFAASKLGPTPVLLPLVLAAVSLCCAIGSIALALVSRKRQRPQWLLHLVSLVIWIGLIAFNLWSFQSVVYVA